MTRAVSSPESDDSFGQTSIGAYKLATMIKVSDELLNDSVFNIRELYSPRNLQEELVQRKRRHSLSVTVKENRKGFSVRPILE